MKGKISHESSRRQDLIAVAILGLYVLLNFVLRLLVSPSMELDESEQFLLVTAPYISLQPLLYSVIVKGISLLTGQIFLSIIMVKYVILLIFYLCFYVLARTYWNSRESLVVTASLMLFPTYSYEFVRDLSHSILASAFAVIASFLYIRTLSSKNTKIYFAILIVLCLGMFSKYVFVFFLVSLILSTFMVKERWKSMSMRWMLLVTISLSLSSVALFILLDSDAFTFLRSIRDITHHGMLDLGAPINVSNVLFKTFIDIAIFSTAFLLFFYGRLSISTGGGSPRVVFFRSLAVVGTFVPLVTILLFQLGQFKARWLATVMFSIPLAFFSLVDTKKNRKRINLFGICCAAIAIAILFARGFVGFFPDVIGKRERIHIPFQAASAEVVQRFATLPAGDVGEMLIISNRQYLIANMMHCLNTHQYVLLNDEINTITPDNLSAVKMRGGIIIWDAWVEGDSIPEYFLKTFPSAEPLEPVRVPYVRSKEIFAMGVAIVPKVR